MYVIHAERDSICAGDDCNAPNAEDIMLDRGARVSELLEKTVKYVHNVYDSVWLVMKDNYKSNKIPGFVVFDENGSHYCELAVPDGNVEMLGIKKIFCRHFVSGDFIYGWKKGLYPEDMKLIDKVKMYLRDYKPEGLL